MAYAILAGANGHAVGTSLGTTATTASVNSTGADLIVLCCTSFWAGGSNHISFPNDSKSNVYTALTNITNGAVQVRIGYAQGSLTVGAGHTFSASCADTALACYALLFSGSAASPSDGNATGTQAASLTATEPSISPAVANELFVALTGYGQTRSDTTSIDSGYTITDDTKSVANIIGGTAAYLISVNSNAEAPTWTMGTNAQAFTMAHASFKPSGGGGGRGLFELANMAGLGGGGSFFVNPLG